MPTPEELEKGYRDGFARGTFSVATKDLIGDEIIRASGRSGEAQQSNTLDDIQEFYNCSTWIYAATYAIATRLAAVPLYATRMVDGQPEDARDSELQQLIDHPAEGMSSFEFLQAVISYCVLTGFGSAMAEREGVGTERAEIAASTDGPIRWLSPLRTSRLDIKPPKTPAQEQQAVGNVWRYEHDISGQKLLMHPSNVLAMRTFNPMSDFWGLSAVEVVKAVIEGDDTLLGLNNDLLGQGGVPDAALETDQRLDGPVVNRKRFEWEQRYRKGKGGGVVVLDNGLKMRPLGFAPKDMQYEELARRYQHRILAAMGVPPLLVMDLRDASLLANAATQERLFYTQTLQPYGRLYADAFTRLIATDPRFPTEQGWGVRWAWDEVDALQETQARQRTEDRSDWQAGAITLNEYRQSIGRDPVEDGDRYFTTGSGGGLGDLLTLSTSPGAATIKVRPQATEEFKALARSAHQSRFRNELKNIHKSVRGFFLDQRKRVKRRIEEHFDMKAHRDGDYADEGTLAALFPVNEENDLLREKVGPVFLDSLIEAARAKQQELFPEAEFDAIRESNEIVRRFVDTWSGEKITRINDETRRSVRDLLVRAFEDGMPPNELAREIEDLFKHWTNPPGDNLKSRAERIARTETNTALNTGAHAANLAAEADGVEIRKQWLSSRDGLVRASHRDMDSLTSGSPIPLTQPFANGLMYPSDPNGSASEVINCRCSSIETVIVPGVTTP